MDNEREIQEVRMGKESIMSRPGFKIVLDDNIAREYRTDIYGAARWLTKELWLGPGAFIIWKES